jgi:hypothetical protein
LRSGENFVGPALAGLGAFSVGVFPGLQPGLSRYGLSAPSNGPEQTLSLPSCPADDPALTFDILRFPCLLSA